jgi:CRP/FNR family transcriptional regulator, cyclic AMP receptor protein
LNIEKKQHLAKGSNVELGNRSGTASDENVDDVVQQLTIEIATHPFVKGMRPEHVRLLASQGVRAWFDRDESVLKEANMANRFYLIQEGKVALEAPIEESAPIVMQMIGAGDELGWSWLFPEHYFHLDARAIEPTRAVMFFGPALLQECARDHEFGYELAMRTANGLTKQLMATREKLAEIYRKL